MIPGHHAKNHSSEMPKGKNTLKKKVARLERTAYTPDNVSQGPLVQKMRAEVARIAKNSNVGPKPTRPVKQGRHAILTPPHAVQEAFEKGFIPDAPVVLQNNIEPTIRSRTFTTLYDTNLAVATGTTVAVYSSSAAHSYTDGVDTPKSFRTQLVNLGGGVTVAPGPLAVYDGATTYSGRPVWTATNAGSAIALTGTATPVPPSVESPFTQIMAPSGATATGFRWYPKRMRFRAVNQSVIGNRGGIGHLLVPYNGFPEVSGGSVALDTLANYGLYKVYANAQAMPDSGEAKWLTIPFRNTQRAFHACTASTTSSWGQAAFIYAVENLTGFTQSIDIQVEIVWAIAGNGVRGLDSAHVSPPGLDGKLRAVNDVRMNTNRLPQDEKGKESIHEVVELASNGALQHTLPSPATRLMEAAGRHAGALVEAGMTHVLSGAERAIGGIFG